jgi:CheY-like chemotaxis protein
VTPKPPTIFLIDDDASVRKALARVLKSAGHPVAVFASARAFQGQYRPGTPGCLVIDLELPGSWPDLQLLSGRGISPTDRHCRQSRRHPHEYPGRSGGFPHQAVRPPGASGRGRAGIDQGRRGARVPQ